MDKFLANLHKKPDHHKKRFALLASGTITLFIFGIWSLANFGISGGVVSKDVDTQTVATRTNNEVSPFESFRMNVASSLEALSESFGELKSGLDNVDLESEYEGIRDGALKVYGQ